MEGASEHIAHQNSVVVVNEDREALRQVGQGIAELWGFQDPADKVLSNVVWIQHLPSFEQKFAPDYLLWSLLTQITDSAVSVETTGPKESK